MIVAMWMPVLEGIFKHMLLIKEVWAAAFFCYLTMSVALWFVNFHCIDILDQGWITLRYPYGDYFSGCKDYAVTEILFMCDHSDQLVSISSYSLNL